MSPQLLWCVVWINVESFVEEKVLTNDTSKRKKGLHCNFFYVLVVVEGKGV